MTNFSAVSLTVCLEVALSTAKSCRLGGALFALLPSSWKEQLLFPPKILQMAEFTYLFCRSSPVRSQSLTDLRSLN